LFLYTDQFVSDRKRIPRLANFGVIGFGDRAVRGAQSSAATLVCAELDLTGGVSGQDFVKAKVQIIVAAFRDQGGQVYGSTVRNPWFNRNRGERGNLYFAAGQPLNVEAQKVLHGFKSQTLTACEQRVIAIASFDREITPPRARVCRFSQTRTHPFLELCDGNCAQICRARAKAGKRRFGVDLCHFMCHGQGLLSQLNRTCVVDRFSDGVEESWAS